MAESDIESTPDIQNIENLQRSYGTNWANKNIRTLNRWISIGAHNIKILEIAINYNRRILRWNSVLGIVLSTATGTLSASQFNTIATTSIFYILFAVLSFGVATSAGFMKIYQIQEKLEEYIKLKQEWIAFSTLIFSEFQLPVHLRQDALFMIWKHKGQYLDLLKVDLEISDYVRERAEKEIRNYTTRFQKRKSGSLSKMVGQEQEPWFSMSLPNLILDTTMYNSMQGDVPSYYLKVSEGPVKKGPGEKMQQMLFRMNSARHGCVQPPDSPVESEDSCTSSVSEEEDKKPRITIVTPEEGS